MDYDVKEKRTLPNGEKKTFVCNHTVAPDNIRGQQLAKVAPHVRRQVGTELLVFGGASSLALRIEDSNRAASGRKPHSFQCWGRASSTDSVGRAGAAAAARRRSPGGSSSIIVRRTVVPVRTPCGGSSRACRTLIVTTRTPSLVSPPCLSAVAQKPVSTALYAHMVQNTDRLVRVDQLLHVGGTPCQG